MLLQKKTQKNSYLISLLPDIISRSQQILPLVGYFILLFALLDYLSFLIPLHLFNPIWELETIGKCVDHIWSLLLGLVMIFYNREQLKLRELRILAWISRLVLVMGIFYFLLFPLAIANGVRIHRQNTTQLSLQFAQQDSRYQAQTELLTNATEAQLAKLITQRNLTLPSLATEETPQQMQQRLLKKLESDRQKSQEQAKATFNQKKWSLIKRTFKWSVGAIISGVMLIWIWVFTDWTRIVSATEVNNRVK